MEVNYEIFKCKSCKREIILPEEYAQSSRTEGNSLVCCFCKCKNVEKQGKYSDLKECMKERSYYRGRNGAIKQR